MEWQYFYRQGSVRLILAGIIAMAAAWIGVKLGGVWGEAACYVILAPAVVLVGGFWGVGPSILAGVIGIGLMEQAAGMPGGIWSGVVRGLLVLGGCLLVGRVIARQRASVRELQSTLQENERRHQNWMDAIPHPAWLSAADCSGVEWNARWFEYTGQTREETLGRRWLDAVHPDDRDLALRRGEDGQRRAEFRLRNHEGEYRWQVATSVPVRGEDGCILHWFGTVVDVEDQRQLAHAAAQSRDVARQTMAISQQFLSILSRDLRTPMAPTLAAAELLESDPNASDSMREAARMIQRNVEAQARLLNGLADMTRSMSGTLKMDPKVVDLHDVVQEVAEGCRGEILRNELRLRLELDAVNRSVKVDAPRLQSVVWNLLRNSIESTPAGGRITVRSFCEDGRILLEISDTGAGMDAEELSSIFCQNSGEIEAALRSRGAALGLSVSRSLIEMLGGSLKVESAGKACGAKFTLALPLAEGAAHTLIPCKVDSDEVLNYRVLVVEDDADTASIVSLALRTAGHNVLVAESVEEALSAAKQREFDVLVCDLRLPDGDGYQVMRAMAARGVPGIAVSANGDDVHVRQSLEAGFTKHLTKPVSVKQILSEIQHVTIGAILT